jgi:hypothetical protein
MSVRLFRYVMVTNNGGAPNYDPPFTTLSICKPMIRKSAEIGDVVMGFAGRALSLHDPNRIVWAGVVREKLTLGEYWRDQRFRSKRPGGASLRHDNIYRRVGERLIQEPNETHSPDHASTDVRGIFVLVMDPA